MIDIEKVDRLYEVGRNMGVTVGWSLFDKRALLSLGQLVDAVRNETREVTSPEALRVKAAAGWYPLLSGAGSDGAEEGAPLYAPSRIGFLVQLERGGYSAAELRAIAEFEEWTIDNVLTVDELAYTDDDLETLVLWTRGRIDALEHGNTNGRPGTSTPHYQEAIRELALLENLKARGVPERLADNVKRHAFRVRAANELIRLELLDPDRRKVMAGYSPLLHFSSWSWSPEGGFAPGKVIWDSTIRSALAQVDAGQVPSLRVPELLLQGDRVVPTRLLRPAEYAALWNQYDIDEYLRVWADARNERRCLNCFKLLVTDADERRKFCGERCRGAAKQRRLRERNPESIQRAQEKYWGSLDQNGAG